MHALDMFKEAVRLLQSAVRTNNENGGIQRSSSTLIRPRPCSIAGAGQEMPQASTSIRPITPCHSPPSFPRIDVDGCFMVCAPIEIASSSPIPTAAAAAVVLFNIALTYHLLRVTSCQRMEATRHALSVYEQAYDLALCSIDHDLSSRVIIVTLTNMALIEREIGNLEEAERCIGDMTEYIMALDAEPSSQQIKTERSEFLHNATLLLAPHGAAAA